MGYVQSREHEAENCYVYMSREELRQAYAELKRLARIDRNFDDERSAKKLEALAENFGEVMTWRIHVEFTLKFAP